MQCLNAGAQPEIFQGRGEGGSCWTGHFDKHFVKNTRAPSGKHFGIFSPIFSLHYILNGKFNPMMSKSQNLSFPDQDTFSIFRKDRAGEASPFLPSCALVSCCWICISIPEYAEISWKCLNKLFWLCQGSGYAWSSYMFDRLLNMPPVLNKPGFWICKGYAEFRICLLWLHMPQ